MEYKINRNYSEFTRKRLLTETLQAAGLLSGPNSPQPQPTQTQTSTTDLDSDHHHHQILLQAIGNSANGFTGADNASYIQEPKLSSSVQNMHSRHQQFLRERRQLQNVGNGTSSVLSNDNNAPSYSPSSSSMRPSTYSVQNVPLRSLEELRETIGIRRQYYREKLFGKNEGCDDDNAGSGSEVGGEAMANSSAGGECNQLAEDLPDQEVIPPAHQDAENNLENENEGVGVNSVQEMKQSALNSSDE